MTELIKQRVSNLKVNIFVALEINETLKQLTTKTTTLTTADNENFRSKKLIVSLVRVS